MFAVEAQLSAILAALPPQQAPQPTPGDFWTAGSSFGATNMSSLVMQPQPSFEELQHTAAQTQQLLMAGHRLEALRQVSLSALCTLPCVLCCDLDVFALCWNTEVRGGAERT